MPKKPTLKELWDLRDRVTYKILGEQDPEWRGELEFLKNRINKKIEMVKRGIYIDPPWPQNMLD